MLELKRLVYRIMLIVVVIGLAMLVLYAADPTRPWMKAHVINPLVPIFGNIYNAFIASAPIQYLINHPIISHIVVGIVFVCPISFPMIHSLFNRTRSWWVKSAAKESGYPYLSKENIGMGKPQSVTVQQEQPAPVASKPEPQPEPVQETPPEPPSSEETAT